MANCPSALKEISHPVQFVGLSSDDVTLPVCYVDGDQTVIYFYNIPILESSVCCTFVDLFIMTPASVSAGLHNKIKEAIVPLPLNHLDGMTFAPYV